MNKLDQFFKDKLQEEEITPALGSWDKVLANMEAPAGKKKQLPIYWMAASIAAILLCSWFFINQNNSNVQDQMAEAITIEQQVELATKPIVKIEKVEVQKPILNELSNNQLDDEALVKPIKVNPSQKTNKSSLKKNNTYKASQKAVQQTQTSLAANDSKAPGRVLDKQSTSIIEEELKEIVKTSTTDALVAIMDEPQIEKENQEKKVLTRPTITITYKKSNPQIISDSPLVASSDSNAKEKKRKLTKVISFAADLASGEVWSDLRGAKDDLLSLNSTEETLNQ